MLSIRHYCQIFENILKISNSWKAVSWEPSCSMWTDEQTDKHTYRQTDTWRNLYSLFTILGKGLQKLADKNTYKSQIFNNTWCWVPLDIKPYFSVSPSARAEKRCRKLLLYVWNQFFNHPYFYTSIYVRNFTYNRYHPNMFQRVQKAVSIWWKVGFKDMRESRRVE